jgi:ABC-type amino acid transport substrate-binding protein
MSRSKKRNLQLHETAKPQPDSPGDPPVPTQQAAPKTEGSDVEKSTDVEEVPLTVSPGFHIKIKALVAGIVSLVGVVYGVVRFIEIAPLEEQIRALKDSVVKIETERNTLSSQFGALQNDYKQAIQMVARPVLLTPEDRTSLLGGQLVFEWDYKGNETTNGYVLEIRSFSNSDVPKLISVARPETRRQFYDLGDTPNGEFLWRVRPGSLVNGQVVAQGPWSGTSTFTMFANDIERIKRTGKIMVGSTPTAYDAFVASDANGNLEGFEVDLINWLTRDISSRLGIAPTPTVEIVQIPWSHLFNAVEDGEVDVAIRSITKSVKREREFRNIRFSTGYLKNHQIIVQRAAHGEFPASLSNATIGVKTGSINEKAARYLVQKFHWKIDSSFVNYGDIYEALHEGKLDFALLDSVLAHKFSPSRVVQFGPELDSYLLPFYKEELGSDIEEYSIAVHGSESDNDLEKVIDDSLRSAAGKTAVESFLKKYGL